MAFNQSGNREDEQQMLQQMLGGPQAPTSQTQPVGGAIRGGGGQADTSLDTPAEATFRGDLAGLGMAGPAPALGGGGGGQAQRDSLKYGNAGAMSGFNTGDYGGDLKARNSVKNTFGRIASKYKNAPSSIDAIMGDADFQQYFPGAKKVQGGAGDKIDFGGVLSDFESGVPVGIVDVLQAADPNADSADAWAWMDEANDGGGGAPVGGGLDPMQAGGMDSLDSGALAQILAELQAAQGGGGEDPTQQLLQSLLAGG